MVISYALMPSYGNHWFRVYIGVTIAPAVSEGQSVIPALRSEGSHGTKIDRRPTWCARRSRLSRLNLFACTNAHPDLRPDSRYSNRSPIWSIRSAGPALEQGVAGYAG